MMAMVPPTEERDVVFRDYDLGMTEAAGYPQYMPTPSIKSSDQLNVTTVAKPTRRPGWMRAIVAACLLMMGGLCLLPRAGEFRSASETPANAATSETAGPTAGTYPSKRIEDVRAGDWVLAREEHGERQNWKRVAESYRRTAYHLRHLTFQDANGHTQTLQTTDEHPFWSVTHSRFIDAGNLRPGDLVTSPDGQPQTLTVTHREEHPAGVPVFNFQVEDYHTYYVQSPGAGTRCILVHNSSCPLNDDLAPRGVTTPNAAARAKSQGEYVDPLTNKTVKTPETLAADHIFPKARIKELSGFDKLTPEQQAAVLNNLENFRGLPQSLNASKGSKVDWNTYKDQPLDPLYANKLAELQQAMKKEIQKQIDAFLAG